MTYRLIKTEDLRNLLEAFKKLEAMLDGRDHYRSGVPVESKQAAASRIVNAQMDHLRALLDAPCEPVGKIISGEFSRPLYAPKELL